MSQPEPTPEIRYTTPSGDIRLLRLEGMEACRRNGDGGQVRISTRTMDDRVEVHIEDNGPGTSREGLARLFDPGFQIAKGRIATGNWSLFTARQVIRGQGGEIRVSSAPGKGTSFVVSLPVKRLPAG